MIHMLSLLVSLFAIVQVSAKEDLKRMNFQNGLIRVPVREKVSESPLVHDHLPSHYDPVQDTILLNERGLETLNNSLPIATNLYNDSFGIAITMDSDSMQDLGISTGTEITMQLLISNPYTYFSTGCDAFINVNLPTVKTDCVSTNPFSTVTQQNFVESNFFNSSKLLYCGPGPYISIAGVPWNTSAVYFLEDCQYAPGYFGNTQSYGMVGLGLTYADPNAGTQTLPSLLFSIFINSTSEEGQLIFGVESTYTTNSQLAQNWITNGGWAFTYSNLTFGSQYVDSVGSSIVFDVLYQRIAISQAQYKSIMLHFLEFTDQGMNCSYNDTNYDSSDFSDCYFSGDIWALPNLSYSLGSDDSDYYILPPTVYMEELSNCTFKTMFDVLRPEFWNNEGTVLGTNVMSKFYSVFNQSATTQNITLYPIDPNLFTNTSSTSNTGTCSIPNNLPNNNGNTNTGNNNNSNTNTGNNNNTGSTNPSDTNGTDPAGKGGMNSTLIIIIAVLGVCVLLGGGFLLYRYISLRSKRNRSGTVDGDLSSKLGDKSDEEIRPYSG